MNQYISITSSETPAQNTPLQNIIVRKGTNTTNTTKTISHPTLGDAFVTIYQNASSQVVNV